MFRNRRHVTCQCQSHCGRLGGPGATRLWPGHRERSKSRTLTDLAGGIDLRHARDILSLNFDIRPVIEYSRQDLALVLEHAVDALPSCRQPRALADLRLPT